MRVDQFTKLYTRLGLFEPNHRTRRANENGPLDGILDVKTLEQGNTFVMEGVRVEVRVARQKGGAEIVLMGRGHQPPFFCCELSRAQFPIFHHDTISLTMFQTEQVLPNAVDKYEPALSLRQLARDKTRDTSPMYLIATMLNLDVG